MIWQEHDIIFEDSTHWNSTPSEDASEYILATNKLKKQIQLEKYRDPTKNIIRSSLLHIVELFRDKISRNKLEEIDSNLLSKDCFLILFDSSENTTVEYSSRLGEGFTRIYKNIRITEREIIETNVDVEKGVVIQQCKNLIWYKNKDGNENEGEIIEKMCMEIFTIKHHKIAKYQGMFSLMTESHEPRQFLSSTHKEKMLERIKTINYALAGTPDMKRVADLLDDCTEGKFWCFSTQRYHVFNKYNLLEVFDQMQDKYKVVEIAPFEMRASNMRGKSLCTYVYYLKEQNTKESKKYVFISNVVYSFGEDMKLERITQVGELFPDEEANISFEAYSKEDSLKIVKDLANARQLGSDMFYENRLDFGCIITRLGPTISPGAGVFNGLKNANKILSEERFKGYYERLNITQVDFYIDQNDPCYEVVFVTFCSKFKTLNENHHFSGSFGHNIGVAKICLENGRIMKINNFFSEIFEKIPSPFDDDSFCTDMIIPKEDFY